MWVFHAVWRVTRLPVLGLSHSSVGWPFWVRSCLCQPCCLRVVRFCCGVMLVEYLWSGVIIL